MLGTKRLSEIKTEEHCGTRSEGPDDYGSARPLRRQ